MLVPLHNWYEFPWNPPNPSDSSADSNSALSNQPTAPSDTIPPLENGLLLIRDLFQFGILRLGYYPKSLSLFEAYQQEAVAILRQLQSVLQQEISSRSFSEPTISDLKTSPLTDKPFWMNAEAQFPPLKPSDSSQTAKRSTNKPMTQLHSQIKNALLPVCLEATQKARGDDKELSPQAKAIQAVCKRASFWNAHAKENAADQVLLDLASAILGERIPKEEAKTIPVFAVVELHGKFVLVIHGAPHYRFMGSLEAFDPKNYPFTPATDEQVEDYLDNLAPSELRQILRLEIFQPFLDQLLEDQTELVAVEGIKYEDYGVVKDAAPVGLKGVNAFLDSQQQKQNEDDTNPPF